MLKVNEDILKFTIVIIFTLIGVIIFVIGQIIFYSKRHTRVKNDLELINLNHEKELLNTKLEIQEETFNKISREIHDNISLGLTLAKLQVNNFLSQLTENNQQLESAVDLISKSLIDLNDISKSLDGNALTSNGLISALESEIETLNKSGMYKVNLEIVGDPVYLSSEKDLVLLRIFQEACNNIIKHSKAINIQIMIIYQNQTVEMKISDNGVGFDVNDVKNRKETKKMSGLKNFETRSTLIDAEFNIISVKDIGTTIHIKTPF